MPPPPLQAFFQCFAMLRLMPAFGEFLSNACLHATPASALHGVPGGWAPSDGAISLAHKCVQLVTLLPARLSMAAGQVMAAASDSRVQLCQVAVFAQIVAAMAPLVAFHAHEDRDKQRFLHRLAARRQRDPPPPTPTPHAQGVHAELAAAGLAEREAQEALRRPLFFLLLWQLSSLLWTAIAMHLNACALHSHCPPRP
jgi:hypothetical protein